MIIQVLLFIVILALLGGAGYLFWMNHLNLHHHHQLLFRKYAYIKYIFLLFSSIIVSISIFDIRRGTAETTTKSNGIDVVFVLDVSKSMNALDFKDNNYVYGRLDAAKKMIGNFVIQHPDDRFGLVIFAGDATSVCPLTLDHDIFLTFLQNVDYRNLTEQGTNIENAILLGVERFTLSQHRSKVMILISDGGDVNDAIDYNFIQKSTAKQNIVNIVVGIGTPVGAKIPLGQTPFGEVIYQTYQGHEVISKLNEHTLQQVAKALNGNYTMVKSLGDLGIFDSQVDKLEKNALENGIGSQKKDASRILGLISFVFFLIYIGVAIQEQHLFYRKKCIGKK